MELFESMDHHLAEILGENEYELLSKQAKVSKLNSIHLINLTYPYLIYLTENQLNKFNNQNK